MLFLFVESSDDKDLSSKYFELPYVTLAYSWLLREAAKMFF